MSIFSKLKRKKEGAQDEKINVQETDTASKEKEVRNEDNKPAQGGETDVNNRKSHLKRFWISEKATDLGMQNKHVFVVDTHANKTEIARAVKERFNVTAKQVNIQRYKGKRKRLGAMWGRRPRFKKAIVTLKEGDKLETT